MKRSPKISELLLCSRRGTWTSRSSPVPSRSRENDRKVWPASTPFPRSFGHETVALGAGGNGEREQIGLGLALRVADAQEGDAGAGAVRQLEGYDVGHPDPPDRALLAPEPTTAPQMRREPALEGVQLTA